MCRAGLQGYNVLMSNLGNWPDPVETMKARTNEVLLSFSMGKDSIAAWLAIRDHFERIEPYFLYLVPGLEFVEESLAYWEGKLGTRIHRLPHPSLYRWLNNFVFQPPERCRIIEEARLPEFDYDDLNRLLREDLGMGPLAYCASGVRAADSPMRRTHFVRRGPVIESRKYFYPVWDWTKDRLISAISSAGLKLGREYRWFGRSFDGLDLRFLLPLKKHAPRDYARVLEWFPLADLEVFRYEHRQQA